MREALPPGACIPALPRDTNVRTSQTFTGPEQVLDYVGRYTPRVALSNHRLLDIGNGQVRFLWKDHRDGKQKVLTLTADEFMRRFLLHVLPDRLPRIRCYGFMGNRCREEKLTVCQPARQKLSRIIKTVTKNSRDIHSGNARLAAAAGCG